MGGLNCAALLYFIPFDHLKTYQALRFDALLQLLRKKHSLADQITKFVLYGVQNLKGMYRFLEIQLIPVLRLEDCLGHFGHHRLLISWIFIEFLSNHKPWPALARVAKGAPDQIASIKAEHKVHRFDKNRFTIMDTFIL